MSSPDEKIAAPDSSSEVVPSNEKSVALKMTTEIAPATDHHATAALDSTDIEKHKGHINDEAGHIAIEAITAGDLDPEAAKSVLPKIDMYTLLILCITYGLQFLDKTTMGYSSVFGIILDNHLVGQDYS